MKEKQIMKEQIMKKRIIKKTDYKKERIRIKFRIRSKHLVLHSS